MPGLLTKTTPANCVSAKVEAVVHAVHISGGSMGGMGTSAVACAQPDLFASATPCCAFGNNLPMERLSNLPMFIHHGLADDTVRPAEDRLRV